MTADSRREFIAGLRELADLLEATPGLPVPYSSDLIIYPEGSDEEQRAAVAVAARDLGAAPEATPGGHYRAGREFPGRVRYEVVAIPAQRMNEWRDLTSYHSAFSRPLNSGLPPGGAS